MTTLTEGRHAGGFIVWETLRDYTREVVTIATGGTNPVLEPSTVLRKITADSKYAAHDPAAVDGTETAVAVLWGKADATASDVDAVVLLRGPAIVNGRGAPSLLVADGRLNTRGLGVASRSKSGRGRATVPIFLLVPQVKLRKRLDLARDAEKVGTVKYLSHIWSCDDGSLGLIRE